MKFAKIVFWIAGIWGVLVLAPLYFMFDMIGRQDPPAITHPGFYYGFIILGLAWQVAFFVIARDPVRFRLMMIPSMVEKFGYGASLLALYLQHRLHPSDLIFGGVDVLFGALFLLAFFRSSVQKFFSGEFRSDSVFEKPLTAEGAEGRGERQEDRAQTRRH